MEVTNWINQVSGWIALVGVLIAAIPSALALMRDTPESLLLRRWIRQGAVLAIMGAPSVAFWFEAPFVAAFLAGCGTIFFAGAISLEGGLNARNVLGLAFMVLICSLAMTSGLTAKVITIAERQTRAMEGMVDTLTGVLRRLEEAESELADLKSERNNP